MRKTGDILGAYDKLSYRLRTQNKTYDDFCQSNDLQKQYDRIKVAGFKRKQSAAANGVATRYQSANVLKNAAGQDIIKVKRTSVTGKPNSITQYTNAKGGIDRNYYGNDGKQTLQISNNGHGHKTEELLGKHGEHAHDYRWDNAGNFTRSEARELNEQERGDNSDIL